MKTKKFNYNGQKYTESWISELKSIKIPKNYISLAKWCEKNDISLQFAHKVLNKSLRRNTRKSSILILKNVIYEKIHGRNICFIKKNTKRNELLVSKLHNFQEKLKNYITITEFCRENKISEHGLRKNLKFLPPNTIVDFLGKKLILKTAVSNPKQIRLNFLKRTYNQNYITTPDFAKLNSVTKTWILFLIKNHRIKNAIMLEKRWYVPENTKIKNFKPWGMK